MSSLSTEPLLSARGPWSKGMVMLCPARTVKYALTPQKGGFLAGGFSHTLNPYKGCGFGRTGCPFCYVRESPVEIGSCGLGHLGAAKRQHRRSVRKRVAWPTSPSLSCIHVVSD